MREDHGNIVKIQELGSVEKERLGSIGVDISLFSDCYILPGFTDVHVHLREPGFLYKETMKSGTLAAAAGGFTDVFSMPNLEPCPDSVENLRVQLEAIEKDAVVRVFPYGAITKGEKGEAAADMEDLAPYVIGFTDDGRGVASDDMMRSAMKRAKRLGKLIVAHCEDENYTRESSESEWKQLERDIRLVEDTGCSYHMCHVSTKESVGMIRRAKRSGLDVTCETAPHYLTICDEDIRDSGRFKMNPPIKKREDMEALLEALADGTIDMIATDHAPHSAEEKGKGFAKSAYGIVGLETVFPVLYTELVKKGVITAERLVELLYDEPRKRFGLRADRISDELKTGKPTFAVWDLSEEYTIDPKMFMSKGRSCPFEGWRVAGRCVATAVDGEIVWERGGSRA